MRIISFLCILMLVCSVAFSQPQRVLVHEGNQPVFTSSDGKNLSIDGKDGGLVCVSETIYDIHEEKRYCVASFNAFTGAGHQLISITVPAEECHFTYSFAGTGDTQIFFYEDATIAGGTTITPYNHDRNSTNTADLVLKYGTNEPTASGNFIESFAFGDTGNFGIQQSGSAGVFNEIILKESATYFFRIHNLSTTNEVSYKFSWSEG